MGRAHRIGSDGRVASMLDRVWLGPSTKNLSREQLAPVVRLGDSAIVPNRAAARQWPFVLTLADVAWGTSGACAAIVRFVVR